MHILGYDSPPRRFDAVLAHQNSWGRDHVRMLCVQEIITWLRFPKLFSTLVHVGESSIRQSQHSLLITLSYHTCSAGERIKRFGILAYCN